MATYDELMNRKTSLEFEINTYRRLLECEETRIKSGVSSTYSYGSSSRSQAQSGGAIGSLISQASVPASSGKVITTTVTETTTSSSNGAPQVAEVAQTRQYGQRGSSSELSTETITKRMQVQRTSKGNSPDDN